MSEVLSPFFPALLGNEEKWALDVHPLTLALLLALGLQLFHQQVLPTISCGVLVLTWLWLP